VPRSIAFLRAVNVGGRFVKMDVLANHLRKLGHAEVSAFVASGNMVFRSGARSTALLAASLQEALAVRLGFASDVFVRSEPELQAAAARAAALEPRVAPPGEVDALFLAQPLTPAQVAALQALRSPTDEFVVDDAEVYWLCGRKQSDPMFSNILFERKVRAKATMRRASMPAGLAERLRAGKAA